MPQAGEGGGQRGEALDEFSFVIGPTVGQEIVCNLSFRKHFCAVYKTPFFLLFIKKVGRYRTL